MNTVNPSVFCSVLINTSNSPAAIGSRPEVGSSEIRWRIERERRASATRLSSARQFGGELVAVFGHEADHFELGGRDLVHQRL